MKLLLNRMYKCSTYTIGKLFINDEYFCDTCEDKDRGLNSNMSIDEIGKIKIPSETAIPTGIYEISMNIQSQKFKTYKQYQFCNGYLPRLLNIPCFDGILIHIGNTSSSSAGCILVGENKEKGQVINSTATFKKLYPILKEAFDRGEKIEIEII